MPEPQQEQDRITLRGRQIPFVGMAPCTLLVRQMDVSFELLPYALFEYGVRISRSQAGELGVWLTDRTTGHMDG